MFFLSKSKYKFKIGERIRISNPEKIRMTLDYEKKYNGLLFMDQMWNYCNKEATIMKVVKQFEHKKILKVKMPIYILEGITCIGNSELLEKKCDLNCHIMWHEDWLEKI